MTETVRAADVGATILGMRVGGDAGPASRAYASAMLGRGRRNAAIRI